jgi:tRNA nucleotidyltransferase/poly(A) polymerase
MTNPNPTIEPIRSDRPLYWPALVEFLPRLLNIRELYVVGGTVRDVYLGRPVHDLDLTTPGDGRTVARRLANAFEGDYYPLDDERRVGRALIHYEGERWVIDVAQFRGPTLEADLRDRDFTLNALAVDLHDLDHILDPLDGLGAIRAKQLVLCQPASIAHDPVRACRAVRMSLTFGLKMTPDTIRAVKQDGPQIARSSPERVRDELFKLLDTRKASAGLHTLDMLGLLRHILPDVANLKEVEQSPPHTLDVWRHTISVMDFMERIQATIGRERTDNTAANVSLGMIAYSLTAFREQLQTHFAQGWPNDRSHRALLILAALGHDIAKPETQTIEKNGHIHFLKHERIGAERMTEWGQRLRLSSDETKRLSHIVAHHMRPLHLHAGGKLTRRALYRFWRDTGAAGVDVCLLSMADYLGTYGATLNQDDWIRFVELIQALLAGYFQEPDELVEVKPLVSGNVLIDHFNLEPGPLIGEMLDALREAQAVDGLASPDEALAWLAEWLAGRDHDGPNG